MVSSIGLRILEITVFMCRMGFLSQLGKISILFISSSQGTMLGSQMRIISTLVETRVGPLSFSGMLQRKSQL